MSMSANLHRPVSANANGLLGSATKMLTFSDAIGNDVDIFCTEAEADATAKAFIIAQTPGEPLDLLMSAIDCATDYPGTEDSVLNAAELVYAAQAWLAYCEGHAEEQASADPYDRRCDEAKENA